MIKLLASAVTLLCYALQCPIDAQESAPLSHPLPESPLWLSYPAEQGPGAGKHIVLIAADQEYRSEQSLPMLARTLSRVHGFHCTVLFSLNANQQVDPTMKIQWEDKQARHQIPGLQQLESADLVILFSRLITLEENQLQHIYTYLDSGKPLIGLRTANHGFIGFDYRKQGKRVDFGNDVLGGAFRKHHGRWHQDSTRGIVVKEHAQHPILIGVSDVWGPSDVYRTYAEGSQLPAGCTALLLGQPLMGRSHDDEINPELEPLPVAWTKTWSGDGGHAARVFHLTMGSARDFQSAGLRRMLFNAAYWCLQLEVHIDASSSVEILGEYKPLESGFNYAKFGVVPRAPAFYR